MKKIALLLVLCSNLAACTTYTFFNPSTMAAIPPVPEDKAQVVFLRPAGGFSGGHSLIFDITDGKQDVIGVLPPTSKFVLAMEPGKYRLLASEGTRGQISEFNLQANKRFYVLVRPVFTRAFQLRPLTHDPDSDFSQLHPEFNAWKTDTAFVEPAAGVHEWHRKVRDDMAEVQAEAEADWQAKTDAQRRELTLVFEDAEK